MQTWFHRTIEGQLKIGSREATFHCHLKKRALYEWVLFVLHSLDLLHVASQTLSFDVRSPFLFRQSISFRSVRSLFYEATSDSTDRYIYRFTIATLLIQCCNFQYLTFLFSHHTKLVPLEFRSSFIACSWFLKQNVRNLIIKRNYSFTFFVNFISFPYFLFQ